MAPRVRLYRSGVLESEDFPLADISDRLAEPDTTVWLDVCAPDHADVAILAEEFARVFQSQKPELRNRQNARS